MKRVPVETWFRLCVAVSVVGVGCLIGLKVRDAAAAEVASSGSTDELRCSSIGYKRGGSGSGTQWGQLSFCYAKNDFPTAWRGTQRTSTTAGVISADIPGVYAATGTSNSLSCGTGTKPREAWYGPWSGSPWGELPARSVVLRGDCATGTYFNNVNSTQHGNYVAEQSYLYPNSGVGWSLGDSTDTTDTGRSGNGGGIKWYGVSTVSYDDAQALIDWPPDWYTGGGVWTNTACDAVSISGPTPPSRLLQQGSPTRWAVTLPSGSVTDLIDIRFPKMGDATATLRGGDYWHEILDAADYSGVVSSIWYVTPGPVFPASEIEMRCSVDDGATWQYRKWGGVGWTGTGLTDRICSRAEIVWPERDAWFTVGDDIPFGYSVPTDAGTDTFDIEAFQYDFNGEGSVPQFGTDPSVDPGWATVASDIGSGDEGEFVIEAEFSGNPQMVVMRCQDSEGYYYAQYFSGGWVYEFRGDQTSKSCLSGAGFSIDPRSWVPALAGMIGCAFSRAAEALFVPSDEAVSEFMVETEEAVQGNMPSNYVATFVPIASDVVVGLDDAVYSHRTDCVEALAPMVLPGGAGTIDAQELCPEDLPTDSAVRPVLLVLLWFGFVAFMVRMVAAILANESFFGIIGAVGRIDAGEATQGELNRRRVMGYQG